MGVLLEVVADARDVSGDFGAVGEADAGDLAETPSSGFFGVMVVTLTQTPALEGAPCGMNPSCSARFVVLDHLHGRRTWTWSSTRARPLDELVNG